MIESFFNPAPLDDYSDYFKTLLSISGVLFGLIFTALLFVIQSGFSSFKFSRRMFLEQYVAFGNNVLTTLSYLTLMPLGVLYLGFDKVLLSIIYYVFALFFIKTFLDIYKQRGYIHTISSTAFVPSHYGKLRSYFRYIRNLGWLNGFILILWLAALWGYPIAISYQERAAFLITNKGFFYSTLLLLTFSVLQIVIFIPRFFKLSNLELEYKTSADDTAAGGEAALIDYGKERVALRTFLLDHGVTELDGEVDFLDGHLFLYFLQDSEGHEAWFNVNIEVNNSDVFEVRNAVLDYAYKLFSLFERALVDINSFVLSFHIRVGGETATRNIFFRATRPELKEITSKSQDARAAVLSIKNKLFDELFRDL